MQYGPWVQFPDLLKIYYGNPKNAEIECIKWTVNDNNYPEELFVKIKILNKELYDAALLSEKLTSSNNCTMAESMINLGKDYGIDVKFEYS